MASGLGIPFRLPPEQENADLDGVDRSDSCSYSSGDVPVSEHSNNSDRGKGRRNPSIEKTASSTASSGNALAEATKRTRTRTVKSRAIFTPEDDSEKKPRGRGAGRRTKRVYRHHDLQHLLKDEEDHQPKEASTEGEGESQRKRSRNASDGENRWDRIRGKVKLLLLKIRRDAHFLEVYQQDGWKSSGREKLKPTAELQKAKARMRGVKTELREVAKRLTEMNAGGPRWRGLKEDKEGNIDVAGVVCSKCNLGDSDDHDDILLCDYAGCFKAFHQNCLTPAVKPEAFPSEEEDWFCWQCECLTDCLEMIEQEFQGDKLRSWEDVFPNVETDRDSDDRQEILLTESEDSNDESFQGSSSESEDEGGRGSRRLDSTKSSGADNGSSDQEEPEDEEMGWMSDAESVGPDEVAKLHIEAGDLVGYDTEGYDEDASEEACLTRRDRGSRSRTRRKSALGNSEEGGEASDRRQERRAFVASLAGDGTLDTANILDGRRRRTAVDYVKLNQDLFGDDYCDDLDGDKASSEAESESSEASTASQPPPKRKRQSKRSIDPFTGEKRKRGRPRKFPVVSIKCSEETTEKRKRGRPRKIASVPGNSAPNATSVGEGTQKRKRGRPRKVPVVNSEESGQGQTDANAASATAARVNVPVMENEESGQGQTCATPASAKAAVVSATGAQSAVGAAVTSPSVPQPGQPSAHASSSTGVTPPTRVTAAPGHGLRSGNSSSIGSTTATVATKLEPPPVAVKRGRGRPRKNPLPSPTPHPSGPETDAASNA